MLGRKFEIKYEPVTSDHRKEKIAEVCGAVATYIVYLLGVRDGALLGTALGVYIVVGISLG